jgi:hypothetical protein
LNKLVRTGLFAAILTVTAPAWAVNIVANRDADAVNGPGSYPTSNFGSSPWISENYASATSVIAHVGFDLSSISPGTVVSATLRLFHEFNQQNGISFDIYRITGAWAENTLNYSNRPTLAGSPSASFTISDSSAGVIRTVDVTSLVQGWVNGSFTNHGLAILRNPDSAAWPYFRSKDNSTGPGPTLDITLVPEPSTMFALAAGAAALLRRRAKKA